MSHYFYDNNYFDSAPELAIYIYLKDNNIDFQYQPKDNLIYTFNNISHKYFPDFKINNQYLEIKGDHMLDKITGKWICPWDHSLDDLYECKHKFLLQLNVKILYYNEYIFYINYIKNKYGKEYLKQFKSIK